MSSTHLQIMPSEVVEYFTLAQVSSLCLISQEEANELVEYGAIRFDRVIDEESYLSIGRLEPLQAACKLRRDFDMDLFTVVVSVAHLETIADLERQIEKYEALTRSVIA